MLPLLFAAVCDGLAGLAGLVMQQLIVGKIADSIKGELADGFDRSPEERIIGEAFESGLDHLQLARGTSTLNSRFDELRRARDSFIRAKNVEGALLKAGRASVYVGGCSAMLGESDSALRFYENGYRLLSLREMECLQYFHLGTERVPKSFVEFTECKGWKTMGFTRRYFLTVTAKAIVPGSWVNVQFGTLYSFMRPLSRLLKSKGSRLSYLSSPDGLTLANLPERRAVYLEHKCDFKFK